LNVLDASVVVDALVVVGPSGGAARATLRAESDVHVPAIWLAEVTSALRSMVRRDEVSGARAAAALEQAGTLRHIEYPFGPFAHRAWELRETLTVYDAWYVALAEQLGCALVTADDRLRKADGPRCEILPAG
jgi:predicted nucleic acid-binding protein